MPRGLISTIKRIGCQLKIEEVGPTTRCLPRDQLRFRNSTVDLSVCHETLNFLYCAR